MLGKVKNNGECFSSAHRAAQMVPAGCKSNTADPLKVRSETKGLSHQQQRLLPLVKLTWLGSLHLFQAALCAEGAECCRAGG